MPTLFGLINLCETSHKPGSVVNGHLSSLNVTIQLRDFCPVPPGDMCRANDPHAVLLRIGFTAPHSYLWAE